ncbi:MAG: hypothetical protein M3164_02755 [Actinomycetota bacterium]|nr:hypothetical protein [Actinomycetota bacterium]
MRLAALAAVAAALILVLAVTGVFARDTELAPVAPVEVKGGAAPAPSPSPASGDRPEWVEREVEEEPFDDRGGDRDRNETRREDRSGRGSDVEDLERQREDNSGSGSGSGRD